MFFDRGSQVFQFFSVECFPGLVRVAFNLADKSYVDVNIYNLNGQRVRTVYTGTLANGQHTIVWDGMNVRGNKVNKGMYMAELMINDYKEVIKLIVK